MNFLNEVIVILANKTWCRAVPPPSEVQVYTNLISPWPLAKSVSRKGFVTIPL